MCWLGRQGLVKEKNKYAQPSTLLLTNYVGRNLKICTAESVFVMNDKTFSSNKIQFVLLDIGRKIQLKKNLIQSLYAFDNKI